MSMEVRSTEWKCQDCKVYAPDGAAWRVNYEGNAILSFEWQRVPVCPRCKQEMEATQLFALKLKGQVYEEISVSSQYLPFKVGIR